MEHSDRLENKPVMPAGAPPAGATATGTLSHAAPASPSTVTVAPPPALTDRHRYSHLLVAHHDRSGPIAEQYRALRARLLASHPSGKFCIMVTSAESGEGKTVTCLNLGLVLAARRECRCVVVDCDLRKKKSGLLMYDKPSVGLADVLRGQRRIHDVLRGTAYPNLVVAPAGQIRRDEAGDLVNRPELEEVVRELRQQFDFILIDTPPLNPVSDASVVGRVADEALIVVRANKTRRESVEAAIRQLTAVNVKVGGLVLTHNRTQAGVIAY